ncbi:unnamed protein product [Paramecium primaurelia]|uniref:Uncharacterized protein n=1 Tax=Paramecium primaurelia TaxID=5886 RepID=A0A8S1LQ78_PARPR|nr:unnamed protein product [Paramecium primaurelia]
MFFVYFASLIYLLAAQEEQESIEDDEFLKPPPDDEGSFAHPLHRTYLQDSYCMDGTQAAAYVYEGSTDDLIMYFYSGGICVEDSTKFLKYGDYVYIDNCTHRNTTFYGTTNGYPEEFNANQGLMGNNKYQNVHLRKAHKMFLMYCDGNMWYKQMNAQVFKGALSQMKLIPKRIILAGSGVGGWYLVNKYNELRTVIKEFYQEDVDLRILLDSVIFDISRNQDIIDAYTEATKRVGLTMDDIFSFDALRKVDVPTFIVHAQYDWWQLEISDGFDCIGKIHLDKCTPKEKKQIEKIRLGILQQLKDLMKSKPDWGLWAISCVFNELIIWTEAWNHPKFQVPMVEGGKLSDKFQDWLENRGDNHVHYDVVSWPDNKPCSNIFHNGKTDPQLDEMIRNYEIKESRRKREEKYDL